MTLGEAACWWPCRNRRSNAGRTLHRGRAHARDRVLDRVAAAGTLPWTRSRGRSMSRCRTDAGRCRYSRRTPPTRWWRPCPTATFIGLTIDATLQKTRRAGARARASARARCLGRHPRGRSCDRRGARARRLGGLFRHSPRRPGRHDFGGTLAGLDAQAVHLWARLRGRLHPSRIADRRSAVRYGGYAPENFDLTFQGTVTVRRALQLSLNVPAVAVLDKVGASRFAARLAQAGGARAAQGRSAGARHGARRRRRQSHRSRCALCRPGAARHSVPLTERIANAEPPVARRLLEPVAAWYVAASCSARRRRRTPPAAASLQDRHVLRHRDAWAVGFDGKRTIGVWVGRPDGAPVPAWSAAWRRRRSCSTPSPAPASCRPCCPARPRERSWPQRQSCRRRCSASARACWRARGGRSCASCSRPRRPARARRRWASPIRSRSRSRAGGRSPCW